MRRLTLLLAVSLAAILFAETARSRSSLLRAADSQRCPPFSETDSRQIELTPDAAKQALLAMMRSDAGQALGFFDGILVDEMSKVGAEKHKDGEYHWTGAYRVNPTKATFVLFVSLRDGRPPLRPHPKGYLLHLKVYEGSFELKDGRWIATVPKYKHTLLD
jgi:hypothetical protein